MFDADSSFQTLLSELSFYDDAGYFKKDILAYVNFNGESVHILDNFHVLTVYQGFVQSFGISLPKTINVYSFLNQTLF